MLLPLLLSPRRYDAAAELPDVFAMPLCHSPVYAASVDAIAAATLFSDYYLPPLPPLMPRDDYFRLRHDAMPPPRRAAIDTFFYAFAACRPCRRLSLRCHAADYVTLTAQPLSEVVEFSRRQSRRYIFSADYCHGFFTAFHGVSPCRAAARFIFTVFAFASFLPYNRTEQCCRFR